MCLWHVTIGNREWQLSVALSLEETAGGAAGSVTSTPEILVTTVPGGRGRHRTVSAVASRRHVDASLDSFTRKKPT